MYTVKQGGGERERKRETMRGNWGLKEEFRGVSHGCGVGTISRLLKITGLFCKRAL